MSGYSVNSPFSSPMFGRRYGCGHAIEFERLYRKDWPDWFKAEPHDYAKCPMCKGDLDAIRWERCFTLWKHGAIEVGKPCRMIINGTDYGMGTCTGITERFSGEVEITVKCFGAGVTTV